jgi:hypothetical protein
MNAKPMRLLALLAISSLFYFTGCHSLTVNTQINGLLRVHPSSPRYFTDNSGKAIYLSGAQIFVDLQDNTFNKSFIYNYQGALNFSWYMRFMRDRNLNYIRNWTLMSTGGASGVIASPMPYTRVPGYGNALDGEPKFDLNRFNQSFFDRMRARVIEAGRNGIYISIMFYDVYAFSNFPRDPMWPGNVFNPANNTNGINADSNGDGWGVEFFTSPSPEIKAYQQKYIRKVIDTVNDLDNVFFELSNEAAGHQWHTEIINYVKSYESSKPKQHLVFYSPGGLSGAGTYDFTSYDEVVGSAADVFAGATAFGDHYRIDTPENNSGKPAIFDMDHIAAGEDLLKSDHTLAWKAFTRGYHFNLYDLPFEEPQAENAAWEIARKNAGAIGTFANKKFADLSKMHPQSGLSSTGYALANPGSEYLIYQSGSGSFSVNLQAGTYNYEWYNPSTASSVASGSITASGGYQSFTPPFKGDAVLYLTSGPAGRKQNLANTHAVRDLHQNLVTNQIFESAAKDSSLLPLGNAGGNQEPSR